MLAIYFKQRMKNILIIFLLLSNILVAQKEFKEIVGKEYKVGSRREKKHNQFKGAVKYGDFYYVVFTKRELEFNYFFFYAHAHGRERDYVLLKLDLKLNFIEKKTLKTDFTKKPVDAVQLMVIGKNLCAFYAFNNLKDNKQYLFARKITPEKMEYNGKAFKIGEVALKTKKMFQPILFEIRTSPDNSKMIVATKNAPVKKKFGRIKPESSESKSFNYWIYDSDFKTISFNKNFQIAKENTILQDFFIDNDGNISALGSKESVLKKQKKSIKGEDELVNTYSLRILKTNGLDETIKLGDGMAFFDAKLIYNSKTNKYAFLGLLSERNQGSSGIICQQIDTDNGKLLNEEEFKFDEDFVKKHEKTRKSKVRGNSKSRNSENKTKKEETSQNSYFTYLRNIGDCYYNDSGELIITSQKFNTYEVTTTTTNAKGGSTTSTVTHYVYGDIFVFKFDDNFNFVNICVVEHDRDVTNGGNKKVDFMTLYNGNLYLICQKEYLKVNFNNEKTKFKPLKNEAIIPKYDNSYNLKFSDNDIFFFNQKGRKLTFARFFLD